MVKHYQIDIPDDDDLDNLSLDDLLDDLDNYIVWTETVEIWSHFLDETRVDISWEVLKALDTSLSLENKINSYVEGEREYLFADISSEIQNTQNIYTLVEIIEYILPNLTIPRHISSKLHKSKNSYYRLYGRNIHTKNNTKQSLPVVNISWEIYHIDMKINIEKLRTLAQGLLNHINTNQEDYKQAA